MAVGGWEKSGSRIGSFVWHIQRTVHIKIDCLWIYGTRAMVCDHISLFEPIRTCTGPGIEIVNFFLFVLSTIDTVQ